jgi:Ca-activated chloride channel family protein
MTPNDEPTLTAYALNEVDAETAAAIEAALDERADWRSEVEEVRAAASLLAEALATESAGAEARRPRVRPVWRWVAGVAALLPLIALVTVGPWRARTPSGGNAVAGIAGDRALDLYTYAPPSPAASREVLENLRALGYVSPDAAEPSASAQGHPAGSPNTESYAHQADNDFLDVAVHPLSTFAMDVDTAAYSNLRRFIAQGQRPPIDAVRIEEMVNYFAYEDEPPVNGDAFAARVEVGPAPWRPGHRLVRIGLKAREPDAAARPAVNLVFLVDVSGSMDEPAKLPLVQQSLRLLAARLDARDRVAIVVYAGAAGLVLPSTPGNQESAIRAAIDRLQAGGSTDGGAGIELAYAIAGRHFMPGGVNRVVLATDGDFNAGITDQGSLVRLVQQKAKQGVFLTALGFGTGNYKDSTLELLANRGNGNYAYIDSLSEARRALVEQMDATLLTVAKDAKIQVEFNPAQVKSYRLIGYENRLLRAEEFADDKKDGGEVGAGQTVTALYEVVPAVEHVTAQDDLRYQTRRGRTGAAGSGELLHLKVRYQEPDGVHSRLLEWPVADSHAAIEDLSADFRFSAAVAGFGMLLRESPHRGQATLDQVLELARGGLGPDRGGYRAEFVSLVQGARPLFRAK